MAEIETDIPDAEAGADDAQTAPDGDGQADTTEDDGAAQDPLQDRTGAGPEDPNDPQYKYWQGAYTQARQRDREKYGTLETEHQTYAEVLRNFYTSDEYALQVLRQRFPQLANQLHMDGQARSAPASPQSSTQAGSLQAELEQNLGPDLAFLAPKLAAALDKVLGSRIDAAVTPLKQETQTREAAARKTQEDTILAEMDTQFPGWEARYGKDMEALDAFLASDALTHPKFGKRHELLYRLVNPDVSRIDATKRMQTAARGRLTTGRAGPPSQPTIEDDVLKAPTNQDAFMLAAQAAVRALGRSA